MTPSIGRNSPSPDDLGDFFSQLDPIVDLGEENGPSSEPSSTSVSTSMGAEHLPAQKTLNNTSTRPLNTRSRKATYTEQEKIIQTLFQRINNSESEEEIAKALGFLGTETVKKYKRTMEDCLNHLEEGNKLNPGDIIEFCAKHFSAERVGRIPKYINDALERALAHRDAYKDAYKGAHKRDNSESKNPEETTPAPVRRSKRRVTKTIPYDPSDRPAGEAATRALHSSNKQQRRLSETAQNPPSSSSSSGAIASQTPQALPMPLMPPLPFAPLPQFIIPPGPPMMLHVPLVPGLPILISPPLFHLPQTYPSFSMLPLPTNST